MEQKYATRFSINEKFEANSKFSRSFRHKNKSTLLGRGTKFPAEGKLCDQNKTCVITFNIEHYCST